MGEKILINLLSEQMLPNLISVLHEQPDRVLALTTPAFRQQVKLFEQVTGTPHAMIAFDAYAFADDLKSLQRLLAKQEADADIAIHFTGGTKIMAMAAVLGAIAESTSRSFRLLYLDTQRTQFEVIRVGPDRAISLPKANPVVFSIPAAAYLGLHGERIVSCCSEPDAAMQSRYDAARLLLKEECDGFFNKQKCLFDEKGRKTLSSGELHFSSRNRKTKEPLGSGTLKWDKSGARIKTPSGIVMEVDGPNAAPFFAGGWLEEYCFTTLLSAGTFNEVLCNVKLDLKPETKERLRREDLFKNEIDVVVTRGLRAALIECKAGNITQDHIYKLVALRDYLLGSFGKAVLVSRCPLNPAVHEKALDLKVEVLTGNKIRQIDKYLKNILEA